MLDYHELLRALKLEQVQFVIVGGFAMVVHGASTVTQDLDFAVALNEENGLAMIRALAPFHPYPPQYGSPTNFVWDERSLVGSVMSLATDVGHIDILRVLPNVDSFEGLLKRSITYEVRGESFQFASLDDLIAMKQAAGPAKDLEHIRQIEAIRSLDSEA